MHRTIKVNSKNDIFTSLKDTSISLLFEYHNFGRKYDVYEDAKILIGMCMDNRKHLRIPDNFAYIIRSGGANLRYSEFKVSYAIAVSGVKEIVLIAHNNCGMVNLISKKEKFISGLVENAGWERALAEEHFFHFAPMFEIENEIEFVSSEAVRLRTKYPKIKVIPLFYNISDNMLYLIEE